MRVTIATRPPEPVATLDGVSTAMVIENAPAWHLGRLGTWLTEAGVEQRVVRPHVGDPIPEQIAPHEALIALGGGRGAAWTPQLTALLRRAVADRVPLLAFCSSARALAAAFGGASAPVAEFRPGPRLLGRRDAAANDPLFGTAPMAIDVVQWRHEALTELPPEAVLLAATPDGAPEVFRLGERAWGVQSHIELDGEMVTGLDGDAALAERVDAVTEHLAETWRPIVDRFAGLSQGRVAGSPLPLLD